MALLFNRVKVNTATAGTGTITLGAAVSNAFCTFAEAGVSNGNVVAYEIEDGSDFEIGIGTYTSAGTTLSRDTVRLSKIGGTSGTTKLTLSGSAVVFLSPAKEDLLSVSETRTANTIYAGPSSGGAAAPTFRALVVADTPSLSKVVNATYDLSTASGNQDITGFGFDPRSAAVNFAINTGSSGGVAYAAGGVQGGSSTATDSGTTWFRQTGTSILVSNAALSAYQQGTISFITDGIRIAWTKGGSPTGTVGLTVLGMQ